MAQLAQKHTKIRFKVHQHNWRPNQTLWNEHILNFFRRFWDELLFLSCSIFASFSTQIVIEFLSNIPLAAETRSQQRPMFQAIYPGWCPALGKGEMFVDLLNIYEYIICKIWNFALVCRFLFCQIANTHDHKKLCLCSWSSFCPRLLSCKIFQGNPSCARRPWTSQEFRNLQGALICSDTVGVANSKSYQMPLCTSPFALGCGRCVFVSANFAFRQSTRKVSCTLCKGADVGNDFIMINYINMLHLINMQNMNMHNRRLFFFLFSLISPENTRQPFWRMDASEMQVSSEWQQKTQVSASESQTTQGILTCTTKKRSAGFVLEETRKRRCWQIEQAIRYNLS